MEKIFNTISLFFAVAGGVLASVFGTWDTVMSALVILIALDYVTGVIKAVYTRTVSSEIGFKGILKKITVFVVVALANVVQKLTGTEAVREMVIMFYISNEGISILENIALLSEKMPSALKNILLQLRDKNDM